ncbi:MAG: SseB family protein [Ruminococcus sp.]|nr:SseB family protein [Ruminococcus sp.]
MAEQNTTKKIDNTALVEAIKEMRENFCPETQNKVINAALRCTFLVPAVLEKKQELVADADNHVKFQDKQSAKFILINHKERGSFFPVFTDPVEIGKLKADQPFRHFAMKFADIAGLTENTPNVNGFIVNPFNQNLPFTKEMLASIKQTLIRVKQEREAAAKAAQGEAASEPNITVSSNEE